MGAHDQSVENRYQNQASYQQERDNGLRLVVVVLVRNVVLAASADAPATAPGAAAAKVDALLDFFGDPNAKGVVYVGPPGVFRHICGDFIDVF